MHTASMALALEPDDIVALSKSPLVALTPLVELAAERAALSAVRPDDLIDEVELERAGLANFARVERLCEVLDERIRDALSLGPEVVQLGRWQFWPLKILCDGVWMRAQLIHRLVTQLEPRKATYVDHPESLYRNVLDCVLPQLNVAARALPARPRRVATFLSRGRRTVKRYARNPIPRALHTGAGQIACLDDWYGVPPIAAELRSRGYGVRTLRHRIPRGALRPEAWAAVERSDEIRALFKWGDLDLWPAAESHLRTIVECGIPMALGVHEAALAHLMRLRPNATLLSIAVTPEQKAVCAAATRLGLPTVVSRHGELGMRDTPIVAYQDLDVVDWSLCWGSWEEAWIARHVKRDVRTAVVGSPLVEAAVAAAPPRRAIRKRLGLAADAEIVLYVPVGLSGEDWYASRRMLTDGAYFREQRRVVHSLLKTGLQVVVKEHPALDPSPLEQWCRDLGGVRVLRRPHFEKLINLADHVVIDAPSTTLALALFGNARITVVDYPVLAWEPGVVEHLQAHGVVFATSETVGDAIPRTAESIHYPVEARAPLVFDGEGTAAERAAEALTSIAFERS